MKTLLINAFAKLNLSLDIVGEDGAGYHLLDGVMLRIDRADKVCLTLTDDGEIRVRCTGPFSEGTPENEENLAVRAARLFLREIGEEGRGVLIEIEKNIPAQAGLGGGSADGAAVLRGLAMLLKPHFPGEELERMGLMLGADLPFSLRGGCVRARGRGERMEPLPAPPGCAFVVAKPAAGSSTREAFSRYDSREDEPPRPRLAALLAALKAGDLSGVGRAMGNVFEALGAPEEVTAIKQTMLAAGALGAAMTGSGTAVAGLFTGEEKALRCVEELQNFPTVFLAKPKA